MTIGFKANNDGSGAIQVNGVDTATVDTSGNLGIGTSTPTYKLQTTDQVYFGTYGGTTQIRLGKNTAALKGAA